MSTVRGSAVFDVPGFVPSPRLCGERVRVRGSSPVPSPPSSLVRRPARLGLLKVDVSLRDTNRSRHGVSGLLSLAVRLTGESSQRTPVLPYVPASGPSTSAASLTICPLGWRYAFTREDNTPSEEPTSRLRPLRRTTMPRQPFPARSDERSCRLCGLAEVLPRSFTTLFADRGTSGSRRTRIGFVLVDRGLPSRPKSHCCI